jgi:hypothetical protein
VECPIPFVLLSEKSRVQERGSDGFGAPCFRSIRSPIAFDISRHPAYQLSGLIRLEHEAAALTRISKTLNKKGSGRHKKPWAQHELHSRFIIEGMCQGDV